MLGFASHTVNSSVLMCQENSHPQSTKEWVWLCAKLFVKTHHRWDLGLALSFANHCCRLIFSRCCISAVPTFMLQETFFFLITKEERTFLLPSTTFQHLPTPVLWELTTSSRPLGSRVLDVCISFYSTSHISRIHVNNHTSRVVRYRHTAW